ncbi:hypothetical protein [Gimesia sp.]|uniref:hypothetical protein n=1 Tax=Gimesia sp. TaxID=2024833 RepID=UPI0025BE7D8B|nr:hypothetical protein [Gimesia sp.]
MVKPSADGSSPLVLQPVNPWYRKKQVCHYVLKENVMQAAVRFSLGYPFCS